MVRILGNSGKYVLACGLGLGMLAPFSAVHAASFKVLYSFDRNSRCCGWGDGLIADAAGNLSGTVNWGGGNKDCRVGGVAGCGALFNIPKGGSATVVYRFKGHNDGADPNGGRVGYRGNVYGVTAAGGGGNCAPWENEHGCGTVYKIAPDGAETVLYAFKGGSDGAFPFLEGLIVDKSGTLYGTTLYGGRSPPTCAGNGGCGTVFKIQQPGTETVLYSFCARNMATINCADGGLPIGSLIADQAGNLFGVTSLGGAHQRGTVFKLGPDGTETVLYSFRGGSDGWLPQAGVTADQAGNIYGTTWGGGGTGCGGIGCGTIYKVAADGSETVLYSFRAGTDGANPAGALLVSRNGNIFGTTYSGGGAGCGDPGCGTVFKLAPDGTEIVLHAFSGGNSGQSPVAALITDKEGNLYGTALYTVFEIGK